MSSQRVYQLQREDTGQVVLKGVRCATTFWPRLIGLQFRKTLLEWCGLLIVPCGSVHTAFVRFPIDVLFLSADGTVNEIRRAVPPWKVVVPKTNAHAVLETVPHAINTSTGTQLSLASLQDEALPPSLEFLKPNPGTKQPTTPKTSARRLRDFISRT